MIRPALLADVPAMARVHVDTWRSAYPGIVPADYLASLSYARCQAGWVEFLSNAQAGAFALVAQDPSGQIVALASGGPLREPVEDFDGEVYCLYVLKACQGLGYGRRLVGEAARRLAGQGFRSLVIWVLKENPACGFYARLGGRRVAEKEVEIGGKSLVDVAYAWSDLSGF